MKLLESRTQIDKEIKIAHCPVLERQQPPARSTSGRPRSQSSSSNCIICTAHHNDHQNANDDHETGDMIINYIQVKKEKQEFTVKMREGDSFLMPQVKVINMMMVNNMITRAMDSRSTLGKKE